MSMTEMLRSRLVAVKWVQGQLAQHAPECSRELSVFLAGAGDRGIASLSSPQAFDWLDTMVHLIDRDAPVLIPDGQFAAHAAAVVNLTAGLADTAAVAVRFNEFGIADLPALGVRVDGGLASAGRSASVNMTAPDPIMTVMPLTEIRPTAESPAPAPVSPEAAPLNRPISVAGVIDRWVGEGRALAADRIRPGLAVAEGALADLLNEASMPISIEGNYGVTDEIRNDSTFDHLSLLSVRRPDVFAAIGAAAAANSDRLARRIVGHTHYIEQRYNLAADTYAELLLGDVEDLDLWRDYCWAMRHSGFEDVTRCWVMHPVEVTTVARAVAFDDTAEGSCEAVARFLEWVSDDLG